MFCRSCKRLLFALAACTALFLPPTAAAQARDERPAVSRRQPPRGYNEAALARGYDDGFDAGLADGRRGKRYDPVQTTEVTDLHEYANRWTIP